jgi:hypothetical protein
MRRSSATRVSSARSRKRLGLGLEGTGAARGRFQHLQRPGQAANLVAPLAAFDGGAEIALRQHLDLTGQPGERPGDGAGQGDRARNGGGQRGEAAEQQRQVGGVEGRVLLRQPLAEQLALHADDLGADPPDRIHRRPARPGGFEPPCLRQRRRIGGQGDLAVRDLRHPGLRGPDPGRRGAPAGAGLSRVSPLRVADGGGVGFAALAQRREKGLGSVQQVPAQPGFLVDHRGDDGLSLPDHLPGMGVPADRLLDVVQEVPVAAAGGGGNQQDAREGDGQLGADTE